MPTRKQRIILGLALLLANCSAEWAFAQAYGLSQSANVLHLSFSKAGMHRFEIDDTPEFVTPVLSRTLQGKSIDLNEEESGLVPGVDYWLRADNGKEATRFRMIVPAVPIDRLSCSVLQRSWRETGRFYVGIAYSQLKWDDTRHDWIPQLPAVPLGETLYSAELFLRPAVHAARVCRDFQTEEEIALYYLAMLNKSETVGSLLQRTNLHADSKRRLSRIDPATRTFAARFGPSQVGEGELYNAQWLYPGADLLRWIAQTPHDKRSAGMDRFVKEFTPFLVREQLLRFLYDQPMPVLGGQSHLGRVRHWELAMNGLNGEHHWDSAMSDIDLWELASAAQVLGAVANDPQVPVTKEQVSQLRKAVTVGVRFFLSKRHLDPGAHDFSGHAVETACYFNGDYDGLPELAGSAEYGAEFPGMSRPAARAGASWDTGHIYRVPVFLRSLYENRKATGLEFPARIDLTQAAQQYVYKVFNGDFAHPLLRNNFDGSDGWFRVDYNGEGFGQPPSQWCDMRNVTRLCMTPGSLLGWGLIAFAQPDLRRLERSFLQLANDPSGDARAFADRHYFWLQPFRAIESNGESLPGGAYYILSADNAEMLVPN